jgi:uncharacterized protein (DUF697 family)
MEMELPPDVILHYAMQLAEVADNGMKESLGPELAGIIRQHAVLGAGAGLIPVPGVDMAAEIANVWTMYVKINRAVGMPFGEHLAKSIATAIGTNILRIIPGLAIAEVAENLAKAFPIFGSATGMIAGAATDYALVLVTGVMYCKALAILLSKKEPLTDENLHKAAEEAGKDKDFIKDVFHEAKKQYKEDEPKSRAANSGT